MQKNKISTFSLAPRACVIKGFSVEENRGAV